MVKTDHMAELADAAAKNNREKVELLLNKTNDLETEGRLWEISHAAARKGHLDIIKCLAEKKPSVLQKKNTDGDTIAHIAVEIGNPSIINYIAEKHASVLMANNSRGETPMHIAARNNRLDIIETIIRNDCIPREDEKECGGTVKDTLETAAKHGYLDIIRYVDGKVCYQRGRVNKQTLYSVCQIAVENDHADVLFYYIEKHRIWPYAYTKSDYKTEYDLFESALKRNITDVATLESFYSIFTGLEEQDTGKGDIIMSIAVKERNLSIIKYIAGKRPSYFVKERQNKDYFVIEAFDNDAVDLSTFKILRQKDISLNVTDHYNGNTILHQAAKKGNLDVIKYVGEGDPHIFEIKNYEGDTVSHIAAKNKSIEIICCVAGINPKALAVPCKDGRTTLHIAVDNFIIDRKTMKSLVEEKGVSLKVVSKWGHTIAHTAGAQNQFKLMDYVMRQEPYVLDKKDTWGNNLLHLLAKSPINDDLEMFKWLVEKKRLPLNATNDDGKTVAQVAVESNNIHVVNYMLDKAPLAFNNSALDSAIAEKFITEMKLKSLIEKGVTPTKNVISTIIKMGDIDFIKYIVEEIPSIFAQKDALIAMARSAAISGYRRTVKYLVETNPDIFISRLDILFEFRDADDISFTIDCLLNACKTPTCNRRAIKSQVTHKAVQENQKELLKCLLETERWDENVLNEKGEPPVFTAVRNGRHGVLTYLGQRNANLTLLNKEKEDILFAAAEVGDVDAMRYVLDEMKAPINLERTNNDGITLLHAVVRKVLTTNDLDMLKYVVEEKGVNIDTRTPDGSTPLQIAARQANYNVTNYLLYHGANPKLKDGNGNDFWHTINSKKPVKEATRKRRSVDTLYVVPDPAISIIYDQAHPPLPVFTDQIEGTGNVDTNVRTQSFGFLDYMTLAMWSFRNVGRMLADHITFPSPADTLRSRMDLSVITAIENEP